MQCRPCRKSVAHQKTDGVGDIVWLSDAPDRQSLCYRGERLVLLVTRISKSKSNGNGERLLKTLPIIRVN
jgi:hypothetical protein